MSDAERSVGKPAEAFAEAAEPQSRDAFLCYCLSVTHDDFRRSVWKNPDLSFTGVCARLDVGTKCTACLLNAENLYYEARKQQPKDLDDGASSGRKQRSWSTRDIYALADALAPSVGVVTHEVVPIVAAPGITTTLTIANSVSSAIGPRSARFKGKLKVFDAKGRLAGTQDFVVPQGSRVDLPVSDLLGGASDASGYAIGSCWVEREPQGKGYRGSIRGHFTIRTPRATTAVHAQEPQKAGSRSFMTSRLNPDEEQFVSLVNCSQDVARAKVAVSLLRGQDGGRELTAEIPAQGSVLLALPRLNQGANDHVHVVTITCDQRARYHLLIRNEDGQRLSVDHV